MRSFVFTPDTAMFIHSPSSFETTGAEQLLTNFDFSEWSSGPVAWTANNGVTVTQNTTNYERNTFSVQLSQTTGNGNISQTVCSTATACAGYIGKTLTFTVREYVMPVADPSTAGLVRIYTNQGYVVSYVNTATSSESIGGWGWASISYKIPTGTTTIPGQHLLRNCRCDADDPCAIRWFDDWLFAA